MATRGEARWRPIVESWKRSGLSLAAYARQEGLHEVTLGLWKRRLQAQTAEAVEFVEVPSAPAVPDSPVPVVAVRGVRIEVPADFDEAALTRLLGVLESRA